MHDHTLIHVAADHNIPNQVGVMDDYCYSNQVAQQQTGDYRNKESRHCVGLELFLGEEVDEPRPLLRLPLTHPDRDHRDDMTDELGGNLQGEGLVESVKGEGLVGDMIKEEVRTETEEEVDNVKGGMAGGAKEEVVMVGCLLEGVVHFGI